MDTRESPETDRVLSFSCKPHDSEACKAISELKAHGKKRGISFSFIVIKAIKSYVKELDVKSRKN